jgi:transposase
VGGQVRRAFKFRFYPTEAQAAELSRTFGCVRKVYNLALQARSEAWTQRRERVGYEATSALLTAWKRTEELAFLAASADRVHELLCQACSVSAVQVAEEVARQRRVHAVGVPVA